MQIPTIHVKLNAIMQNGNVIMTGSNVDWCFFMKSQAILTEDTLESWVDQKAGEIPKF